MTEVDTEEVERAEPLLDATEPMLENPAEEAPRTGNMTIFRAFVVLMNTIIGVGLLGIPYCFRAGIVLNALIVLLVGGASYFSFIVLIDTSIKTGHPIDFARFMKASFSIDISWIPHLVLFITFFGFAILHLQAACSLIQSCLAEISNVPEWCSNRWFLICVPGVVIGIPLILLRSVRGFSNVSMMTCLLIALYVVHSAVYLIIGITRDGFDPDHELRIFQFNEFVIPALSIQAFAFACHPLIGPTLSRLIEPTQARQYRTMTILACGATTCYLAGGLLPYLTLFDKIADPVVFVYYPTGQVFTIVEKALYALFLVFTTPLILFSARLGLNDLIFKTEFTPMRWRVVGISTMAATIILAVTVTSISTMFELIGGVTCNLIVYLLPSLYYIRLCSGDSPVKTVIAWIMMPIGVASMVICLYESIHSIVTRND
jgi:sodium-coupled neutral amino acid transporter 10